MLQFLHIVEREFVIDGNKLNYGPFAPIVFQRQQRETGNNNYYRKINNSQVQDTDKVVGEIPNLKAQRIITRTEDL